MATLVACVIPLPPPAVTIQTAESTLPAATSSAVLRSTPTPCALATVIAPTPPAQIPGYAQLDPNTGLHMTGTVQKIDLESYRLKVTGKVDHPLSLTYDELRCMPRIEQRCTLICPGFFQDQATWAGVPLAHVLGLAGVQAGATGIRLISADSYSTIVGLSQALSDENFLAYEWEGQPLPILHGFPVRAVFPSLPGGNWVKWLVEIRVE